MRAVFITPPPLSRHRPLPPVWAPRQPAFQNSALSLPRWWWHQPLSLPDRLLEDVTRTDATIISMTKTTPRETDDCVTYRMIICLILRFYNLLSPFNLSAFIIKIPHFYIMLRIWIQTTARSFHRYCIRIPYLFVKIRISTTIFYHIIHILCNIVIVLFTINICLFSGFIIYKIYKKRLDTSMISD